MDRMRSSRTAQRVPRSASRSVRDLPPLRLPAVTIVESLSHDPGVAEGLSPDEWDDRVHFGAGLRQKGSPGQGNDRGFRTSAGAGTRGLGSRPTVVRCRASSGGGRHVRCDRSPLSDAFALELTASPGPLRTNRERAQEPLRWPKSTIGCGAGTSKTTWPST